MNKTSTKKVSLNGTKMSKEFDNSGEFPFEPGEQVINNILNYSKALSIRKSKSLDCIEMVLN